MAKREADKKRREDGVTDDSIDDSVEGHVNLQPQDAQEGPNKRAARTPRH